ncbi:UPF0231 protein [Shewanella sp. NFH-SH190041]|uniref:YacL family protein n=1 Tax=Shewanella sp. NFH-SH190041 TaxID=2950245 RepID=UPI0021C3C580|nr:YacL family protein [Shewanella sp. NFH-SH190041]BDM63471.1 UPF0231 protein [Shewanella sp. NFH-SH190041]
MEYEFRRNSLDGTVLALFSMDHEVIGRWLTEELGQNTTAIAELLDVIAALQQNRRSQFRLVGRDLTLELDTEQAWIRANVLGYEQDFELEEAMSLYDCESEAGCGLEDFEQVLLSWQDFLAGR